MRFLLAALALLFSDPAPARWVEPSEVASKVNFERWRYKVRKDATYTLRVERQLEIVKDNARTEQGLTRLTFDASASDFELLEAKTINKDGTYPVRKEHIEVKPLASAGPGFDEHRQITIAFPRVEVGSKLYFRYERHVKKVGVKGLFSETYPIGWNELVESGEIEIESELPLYHEVRDPGSVLDVKAGEDGGLNTLRVSLKKPVLHQIVQEERAQMSALAPPWVAVSSAPSWAAFPAVTPGVYEQVIHSELPAAFLPLLERAKAKKDPYDQIDAVTSGLRERVRYVGDWQQVEGAFHPRPLQLVADTGFGDCKDFTSVTAAVLRQLGFRVHAAWVGRGEDFVPAPTQKIAAYYFNHAIVHAVKNGQTFWIDPTNEQSFSRGIFPDIADKPAFVLEPGAFRLERTPRMDPADSLSEVRVNVTLGKSNKADSEGSIFLSGGAGLSMTAQGLFLSKSQLDYSFLTWITEPGALNEWKLSDYDLRSRIVGDIRIKLTFDETWYPMVTTAGQGYRLPENSYLELFSVRLTERVGDLVLAQPSRARRIYHVRGRQFHFRSPIACSGKSKWIDYSRRITKERGAIVAKEEVTLKVAKVPAAEARSTEFSSMISRLFGCLQTAVAVY